eukprot:2724474-Rhodomonas_salina.1
MTRSLAQPTSWCSGWHSTFARPSSSSAKGGRLGEQKWRDASSADQRASRCQFSHPVRFPHEECVLSAATRRSPLRLTGWHASATTKSRPTVLPLQRSRRLSSTHQSPGGLRSFLAEHQRLH